MTYATTDMVKLRIGVSQTVTSRDEEITAALTFADAYADAMIASEGGATPIASPPQDLKEGAADIAAYFIHRVTNPTVATLYKESGDTLLGRYVKRTLKGKGSTERTGRQGVHEYE